MSSVSANVATWNNDLRRTSSYVVLGAAVVTALVALALWWFLDTTPAWLYWVLVGVLALVLVFMVLLMVLKPRAAVAPAEAAPAAHAAPEAAPAEAAPAVAYEPRVLTLRCGDCGTIFEVTDTGERPLYHTCPGCGAEGALRDPVEAVPAAAEAPAAPAPQWAPPAEAAQPAAEQAPVAPAVKKIKLRCGGCKEVFAIEDTGERPLKRACPNCGRMGMIR